MRDPGDVRKLVRAVIGFGLYLFLGPVLLFSLAGTMAWSSAWVYVAMMVVSTVGSRLLVMRRNPDLLQERAAFAEEGRAPGWDRVLVPIVALIGPAGTLAIAGLDRRLAWSPPVAPGVQILAALIVAAGYGLAVWAMVENRFFSAVARIQEDRGQTVVDTGPYRLVRHPSYGGAFIAGLALPVMLGTLWALVPAVVVNTALVIRTRLEDRMLYDDLAGYRDYASRTHYRLIPGLW